MCVCVCVFVCLTSCSSSQDGSERVCVHVCVCVCVSVSLTSCSSSQDGSERVIESLSLIDAVMPDVVEQRKLAAAKSQQIKTEASSTNGEESAAAISESRGDGGCLTGQVGGGVLPSVSPGGGGGGPRGRRGVGRLSGWLATAVSESLGEERGAAAISELGGGGGASRGMGGERLQWAGWVPLPFVCRKVCVWGGR